MTSACSICQKHSTAVFDVRCVQKPLQLFAVIAFRVQLCYSVHRGDQLLISAADSAHTASYWTLLNDEQVYFRLLTTGSNWVWTTSLSFKGQKFGRFETYPVIFCRAFYRDPVEQTGVYKSLSVPQPWGNVVLSFIVPPRQRSCFSLSSGTESEWAGWWTEWWMERRGRTETQRDV